MGVEAVGGVAFYRPLCFFEFMIYGFCAADVTAALLAETVNFTHIIQVLFCTVYFFLLAHRFALSVAVVSCRLRVEGTVGFVKCLVGAGRAESAQPLQGRIVGVWLGYQGKTTARATQLPQKCRPDAVYVPRVSHNLSLCVCFN